MSSINPLQISNGTLQVASALATVILPSATAPAPSDPALVVAISPNSPITTSTAKASTNTTSSVASSTSNTILLNANSLRLGATIFNDAQSILYVKLGPLATLSDFTIKLWPACYYEVPFLFNGTINGFWSNINQPGFARIGELTA